MNISGKKTKFGLMRTHLWSFFLLCLAVSNLIAQEASLIGQAASATTIAESVIDVGSKSISIKVNDMRTKKPVPFFTIDFSSCGHPTYESNSSGLFSMETAEGFSCYVRIAKSGYTNLDLLLDYDQITGDDKTYKIFLSRSPNHFTGSVKDAANKSRYLENARIELMSTESQQLQTAESNRQGQFSLYLLPNTQYKLSISKNEYKRFDKEFITGDKVESYFIKNILLTPMMTQLRPEGSSTGLSVTRKESAHQQKRDESSYYSIQVLAKQSGTIILGEYDDPLRKYGQLQIESDGKLDKLKVGQFYDRGVAEKVLSRIKLEPGFSHAFITQHLPLQVAANGIEHIGPRYMVRLASYLNPALFDPSKVAVLGHIKSLNKDEWTIMLLEGFKGLDEAKAATEKAKELGFRSAHVVLWDDDKIKRVR